MKPDKKKTLKKKKKIILITLCAVIIIPYLTALAITSYRVNTHRLISAIRDNDIERVEKILERGVDPNLPEYPPSNFWGLFEMSPARPLSVACSVGNYEVIKMLIDYGATAEVSEGTGWSPLMETLFRYQSGDLQTVQLLIENGADPTYREDGYRYITEAADMFPRLPDEEEYNEEAAMEITEIVKIFLVNDSVDTKNHRGQTLLMLAVDRENIRLAEYLISLGCDVEEIDLYDKTAADYAAETRNKELIKLFN